MYRWLVTALKAKELVRAVLKLEARETDNEKVTTVKRRLLLLTLESSSADKIVGNLEK